MSIWVDMGRRLIYSINSKKKVFKLLAGCLPLNRIWYQGLSDSKSRNHESICRMSDFVYLEYTPEHPVCNSSPYSISTLAVVCFHPSACPSKKQCQWHRKQDGCPHCPSSSTQRDHLCRDHRYHYEQQSCAIQSLVSVIQYGKESATHPNDTFSTDQFDKFVCHGALRIALSVGFEVTQVADMTFGVRWGSVIFVVWVDLREWLATIKRRFSEIISHNEGQRLCSRWCCRQTHEREYHVQHSHRCRWCSMIWWWD